LALGGSFDSKRGEWYFSQGTGSEMILRAAGASVEGAVVSDGTDGGESGVLDPLVDEVDAALEGEAGLSARAQVVMRAVKAWTDQLVDRSARNNLELPRFGGQG